MADFNTCFCLSMKFLAATQKGAKWTSCAATYFHLNRNSNAIDLFMMDNIMHV